MEPTERDIDNGLPRADDIVILEPRADGVLEPRTAEAAEPAAERPGRADAVAEPRTADTAEPAAGDEGRTGDLDDTADSRAADLDDTGESAASVASADARGADRSRDSGHAWSAAPEQPEAAEVPGPQSGGQNGQQAITVPAPRPSQQPVRADSASSGDAPADGKWHEIQAMFVDDPRRSVELAAALADDSAQAFITSVHDRLSSLQSSWQGREADTDQLRAALREYRALCGRLGEFSLEP